MAEKERYFPVPLVKGFLSDLYEKAGMSRDDADVCASCVVKTNLWGVDSHGVLRTSVYVNRVRKGAINPRPEIQSLKGNDKAIELLNGDDGIGYIVGKAGMEKAIAKAKQYGMGAVVVDRSNHFGAAALYARMAAEEGMIGFATTNVKPNIGMKGNKKPSTGNNPIAMAAPIGGEYPFSLDISLSAVAGGKLLLASKKGEKIPKDWAVTSEGLETDDPDEGFKGFLLPVGLHKGFGLSLFVDIITGVLSGGAYLQDLKSMYAHSDDPSLTSHFFFAIDPTIFMEKEVFIKRMKDWAGMIKDTPMVDPETSQLIPGELEYKTEQKRIKEGLPFPSQLVSDLDELATDMGVKPISERTA
jgi:LDH2 family malate/lactate/ureidoglycolate dehydrogenase